MQADIAIIIVAYKRTHSLMRLLRTVSEADYSGYQAISLFISIDLSDTNECEVLANAFQWQYGEKKVLLNHVNLGLTGHILKCGDISKEFDGVIILEDDLIVSPYYFKYAQEAYAYYLNDSDVAGIALYRPVFNEIAYCPFDPIDDGYDVFFMQIPCSWGQLWTKGQWKRFREYIDVDRIIKDVDLLPEAVKLWPDGTSWKKIFYRYLIAQDLYFVYPRVGLTTNFGELGQHITEEYSIYQSSILLGVRKYKFSTKVDSLGIYDAYYELDGSVYSKWAKNNLSVSFDLNGTKDIHQIKTEYLISSRTCDEIHKKYDISCYPYELNILMAVEPKSKSNSYFTLGPTSKFRSPKKVNRFNLDIRRLFVNDDFIRNSVTKIIQEMPEFKVGYAIIRPFQFLRRMFSTKRT